MKQKFTIALITLFLLSSCSGMRSCGPYADDIAKQWRIADEGLREVKRYDELAKQARVAKQFSEAKQHSDEASRAAQRVAAAARKSEQLRHTEQLSDDMQKLLQKIQEASVQAPFISLRTQADDAVMETAIRMKTEQGVLADEDLNALHKLSKDFLCFHLEKLANENRLPNEEEYRVFAFKTSLAKFVPLLEIKDKAESVIDFAQNVSAMRSPAEIQARARLLQECNFR